MKKFEREKLKTLVNESNSIKEVLIKLGLRDAGGNYKTFHKYVLEYEISTAHFKTKEDIYKETLGVSVDKTKIPLSEILVIDSTYNRSHLKPRLYKEGLKKRECEMCGQGEEWNGKKMSLILDHINGVHNDNRLENLRIVCPNCNATLDTHCGKNHKK